MKQIPIAAALLLGANLTAFAESAPAQVDQHDPEKTLAAAAAA